MRRNFLRTVVMPSCVFSSALAAPTRGVYTVWEAIPLENRASQESWLKRITTQSVYRGFEFWHVPEIAVPSGIELSEVERYLLSCIENDTSRLMNLSWTYDFDVFWNDRVESHENLFNILYNGSSPFYRFLLGSYSENTAGRRYIETRLNYLKSVLHWATVTEQHYSAITKARYTMQREVWNAFERERYLMGCLEVFESFKAIVPKEFADKAVGELENSLVVMRHWVWDCPNAKRMSATLA